MRLYRTLQNQEIFAGKESKKEQKEGLAVLEEGEALWV
ncbi:hypothetical protein EBME_1694 [bacterium endosymbiont of Mortierella elongata FMR23-6]|nr:hypothetical protein EBME_1694 [bacterium endosymbiont of Mortierella elongata FMR23-6]